MKTNVVGHQGTYNEYPQHMFFVEKLSAVLFSGAIPPGITLYMSQHIHVTLIKSTKIKKTWLWQFIVVRGL